MLWSELALVRWSSAVMVGRRGEDDISQLAPTKIGCVSGLSGCATARRGYAHELLDGGALAATNLPLRGVAWRRR